MLRTSLVLTLALATAATADEIVLVNPSFEFPLPAVEVSGMDHPLFDVPGWHSNNTDVGATRLSPTSFAFAPDAGHTPPEVAWTADGYIYQHLPVELELGRQYRLVLKLGNSADVSLEESDFTLEPEDTGLHATFGVGGDGFELVRTRGLLQTSTTLAIPPPGKFGEVVKTFYSHPDHFTSAWAGEPVTLLFACGCAGFFDDFRVFVEEGTGPFSLADVNGDGVVGLDDFGVLKANFGKSFARHDQGDINYDGKVDLADFGILKKDFGLTAPAAVPEPATLWLALLAASLAVVVHLRRRSPRTLPKNGSHENHHPHYVAHAGASHSRYGRYRVGAGLRRSLAGGHAARHDRQRRLRLRQQGPRPLAHLGPRAHSGAGQLLDVCRHGRRQTWSDHAACRPRWLDGAASQSGRPGGAQRVCFAPAGPRARTVQRDRPNRRPDGRLP